MTDCKGEKIMLNKKKIISFLIIASTVMSYLNFSVHADDYIYVDESFEDGILPEYFTTKIPGEGSVTVETDPKTGEKAVKVLSEAKNESYTGFSVPFETVKNGILTIEFRMRCEKRQSVFNDLTVSGDGGRLVDYVDLKGDLYFYQGKWQEKYVTKLTADYKNFKYVIDMDTKKLDIYINDKLIRSKVDFYSGSVTSANSLNFYNSYSDKRYGAGGAWLPDGSEEAIFWIDDIKVWQRGLLVAETVPAENAEIGISEGVKVTFNEDLDYSDIRDYVEVYQGETEVNKEKYIASAENNELAIFFMDGFEYNTSYCLRLLEGLKAADESILPLKENFTLNFKTERLFEEIENLEDGGSYSSVNVTLPEKNGVTVTALLKKPDGSEEEYLSGRELAEIGSYTLTVTGVNGENGKSQTDVYNFEVVGEQPPVANDVSVKLKEDEKLTKTSVLFIDWSYFDVNGDSEGEHKYQWYVSDKKDSGFEVIEDAKNPEYVLSEKVVNKYIKASVIPVSEKEEGEECFSDVFKGFFLPEASDVTIIGNMGLSEELTASYKYKDENDDTGESENGTVVLWYKSTDDGKSWMKIEGTEGLKYTVSESDADCLIKVGVKPVKENAEGIEVFSDFVLGLMRPEAQDVKIEGVKKVGQTVFVSYLFSDKNKDSEGKTEIKWYADGKMISEGKSLILTSEMKGKEIYVTVTPVSESYPYEGETIQSDSISVSASVQKGGGGGGGSAISITPPAVTPEKEEEKNNSIEKEETDKKIIFKDIENHWAKDTIIEMYENGVVKGISDNEFSPDTFITRAQFAMMISKLIGLEVRDEKTEFSDISKGAWYEDAVLKVASNGVMKGSDGNFRPDDNITREEICQVIKNLKKPDDVDTAMLEVFKDRENISDWAREAVAYAISKEIVKGKGNNLFLPRDNATRAEGLVMLKRMTDKLEVTE